jgi:hypothetical protein
MAGNKRGSGTHHVVPNSAGGWDVRRGGTIGSAGISRPSSRPSTAAGR